jgi:hypothetical protein
LAIFKSTHQGALEDFPRVSKIEAVLANILFVLLFIPLEFHVVVTPNVVTINNIVFPKKRKANVSLEPRGCGGGSIFVFQPAWGQPQKTQITAMMASRL